VTVREDRHSVFGTHSGHHVSACLSEPDPVACLVVSDHAGQQELGEIRDIGVASGARLRQREQFADPPRDVNSGAERRVGNGSHFVDQRVRPGRVVQRFEKPVIVGDSGVIRERFLNLGLRLRPEGAGERVRFNAPSDSDRVTFDRVAGARLRTRLIRGRPTVRHVPCLVLGARHIEETLGGHRRIVGHWTRVHSEAFRGFHGRQRVGQRHHGTRPGQIQHRSGRGDTRRRYEPLRRRQLGFVDSSASLGERFAPFPVSRSENTFRSVRVPKIGGLHCLRDVLPPITDCCAS